MKLSFAVIWALCITLGAGVAACSGGLSGPDGSGGGGGGSTSSGVTTSSSASGAGGCDKAPSCSDCVNCARLGPCAKQSDTCNMNPDCILMDACMIDCGPNNPPCHALCQEAHPDGVPAFNALRACTTSACPMPCGPGGG